MWLSLIFINVDMDYTVFWIALWTVHKTTKAVKKTKRVPLLLVNLNEASLQMEKWRNFVALFGVLKCVFLL